MEYIVWFENLTKDSLSVAGGKGANLGEMTRLRLPVPPGFAITTRAFDTFLNVNKIKEKIDELVQSTNVDDTQQLVNTSSRVKQLIVNAEMPVDIRNSILEAYKNLSFTYTAMKEIVNPEAVRLISAGRDLALVAEDDAPHRSLPILGECPGLLRECVLQLRLIVEGRKHGQALRCDEALLHDWVLQICLS